MADVLLLAAFIALPILAWWFSRSMTVVVIGLLVGFGLAGNFAQTAISMGWSWNVRTLQVTALLVMLAVFAWSVGARFRTGLPGDIRRQLIGLLVPALVVGIFLIAMRVLADGAGPMSAVGYFINHPLAEDNAKWLHLSAQLADGRDISFNGYAGGPLLLLMSVMAAAMSVLSMLWLGGVNEVAVAANTVLATQFLLIALVPFALAPLVDRRAPVLAGRFAAHSRLPLPLVWVGMLVAITASAIITSYGHLSLQYVIPVLVLWIVSFLGHTSTRERLLMTLAIVTLASVWFPLNVLGLLLLFAALIWSIRKRRAFDVVLVVLTGLVSWDALFSSVAYMLGIQIELDQLTAALPFTDVSESADAWVVIESSGHLFKAPGGTEIVQPLIAGLTLVAILAIVWLFVRAGLPQSSVARKMAPTILLFGYAVLVMAADAVSTGSGPNYGANKLMFAVVIAVLAACLPLALTALDPSISGMSILRWFGVAGVVVLLSVDSLLPRALSAMSPVLWPGVDAERPQYWSVAEVKDQPDQPLSSLPVACLFVPQGGGAPTALPLGQESYACTRLLIGLGGLEGRVGLLPLVLQDDWLVNQTTWESRIEGLRATSDLVADRTVIAMTPDGGVAGISVLAELLARP